MLSSCESSANVQYVVADKRIEIYSLYVFRCI